MHLLQVYHEYRTAIRCEAAETALAGRDRRWGAVLDEIYDDAILDLRGLDVTLLRALENIEAR